MCLTKFRGQSLVNTGRLFTSHLNCRFTSTHTEDSITDPDFDEEEIRKKLAKIRDCSGLSEREKMQHYGKMRDLEELFGRNYKGKKRNKLRRLYAEYGKESGKHDIFVKFFLVH